MEEISRDDIYTVTKSSNIDKTTLQTYPPYELHV